VVGILGAGLAVGMFGAVLWLVLEPGRAWCVEYHDVPDILTGACLVSGVVVIGWFGTWERRVRCNLLLTATMTALYFLAVVAPLGDYPQWVLRSAADTVGVSELFGNAVYRLAFVIGGRNAVFLVAPVFGCVTAFVFLSLCDKLFLNAADPRRDTVKKLCCLGFLAGAWHLLFFTRYVENAQTSLPGLLLSLWFLADYRRAARPRAVFCLGATALAGAALFHGSCLGLLPALPCMAWLGAAGDRPVAARWGDLAMGAVAFAATMAAAIGLLVAIGMEIDSEVVWSVGSFDGTHARFVANALLLASPLVLAMPFVVATRAGRENLQRQPVLTIFASGYGAFLVIGNFDLGFPGDYAALLSMGLLLHLFLLNGAIGLAKASNLGTAIVMACIAAGGMIAWSVIGALAVPGGPYPAAHPNGPRWEGAVRRRDELVVPTLFVNGRTGVVQLRRGERITWEMRNPPGRREPTPFVLAVHRGTPSASDDEGLVIPVRGPYGEQTILIANSLLPQADTTGVSLMQAPRSGFYPGASPEHATLQGLIRDATGAIRATNALLVRRPRGNHQD
jgi:hypothetical protein